MAYAAARFGLDNGDNMDDIDLDDLNTQGEYAHEVRKENDPDNCIQGKFACLFICLTFF